MFFVQMTASRLTDPLVFVPSEILTHPWSIVTYMFLHGNIQHILFNMLGLYFFGPRVEVRLGSARFVRMYFIAGISGALLSFIFAPNSGVIGASAGIYGILMAFAYFWPRDQLLIWGILPVEARWLVIIYTVMSLYGGIGGSAGGVADFAHLGGFIGAYLYLRTVSTNRGMKKFRTRAAGRVADKTLGNWQKVDTSRIHELNRDEVNRILDKISNSGVDSLTAQEKLFLSNFVPPDDRIPPTS